MAVNETLARRVREALVELGPYTERKMFGGLCFLANGNMVCGVTGEDLMVRVGPEAQPAALREPHARPMDFTGRPMKGFVFVGPEGTASMEALNAWIGRGLDHALSLPPR